MNGLLAAWFVEVGIITVRDFAQHRRPPLPSELLASFVIFGGLSLAPRQAEGAATLAGWGIVVGTLLGSSLDVLAPFADFMSGRIGATTGPNAIPGTDPYGQNVDPNIGPLPGLGGGVPYGAPGFPVAPPQKGN